MTPNVVIFLFFSFLPPRLLALGALIQNVMPNKKPKGEPTGQTALSNAKAVGSLSLQHQNKECSGGAMRRGGDREGGGGSDAPPCPKYHQPGCENLCHWQSAPQKPGLSAPLHIASTVHGQPCSQQQHKI